MTNLAISASAVASWAVPAVAEARSRRYAAAIQIDGKTVEVVKSIPAALRSLGVFKGQRTIRAAARDNAFVELNIDGKTVVIASLEVN